MDLPTPTFGAEFFNIHSTCHFSELLENMNKSHKKEKLYSKILSKNGKKKLKNSPKKKGRSHKKRSKTCKIKRDIIENNEKIKEQKFLEKYKENVNNFIRNHRFELRDDFNEKNVNKFLSSKERAFEIPIILSKEIILEY